MRMHKMLGAVMALATIALIWAAWPERGLLFCIMLGFSGFGLALAWLRWNSLPDSSKPLWLAWGMGTNVAGLLVVFFSRIEPLGALPFVLAAGGYITLWKSPSGNERRELSSAH